MKFPFYSHCVADPTPNSFQPLYPRTKWIVVALGFFTAALITFYWLLWFLARDIAASFNTQAYYEYEEAFILADVYLGLVAVAAAISLCLDKPWAVLLSATAGSAGLYLACMDFLYDLQHGVFDFGHSTNVGGGAVELFIVLYTFSSSGYALGWSYWVIYRRMVKTSL
ncbi:hypothetical protein BC938DRAFT_471615 [Jimgerdemannia flammicorona]|uniref:Uncharacterized protein n=1 Tax=Jimgerdemannia flammicorona TaxID=994334 RepID=A0A433Q7Q5_9FUNG|nr:hypothetical protein BC938DRAFT_471615 [Jimgerdemannia flammicorona]